MSYKNLEVWQIAREVSIDIHKMTLTELPKSLKNKDLYDKIHNGLETLGRKLNLFLQSFD